MAKTPATIHETRRDCLIATSGSTQKMFEANIGEDTHYGLADTEHQFKLGLIDHIATVRKVPASEISTMFAEELKEK